MLLFSLISQARCRWLVVVAVAVRESCKFAQVANCLLSKITLLSLLSYTIGGGSIGNANYEQQQQQVASVG